MFHEEAFLSQGHDQICRMDEHESVAVVLDPLIWKQALLQAGLSHREFAVVRPSRVTLHLIKWKLLCLLNTTPFMVGAR